MMPGPRDPVLHFARETTCFQRAAGQHRMETMCARARGNIQVAPDLSLEFSVILPGKTPASGPEIAGIARVFTEGGAALRRHPLTGIDVRLGRGDSGGRLNGHSKRSS